MDEFVFDESFVAEQLESFREELQENILLVENKLLELEKNPASRDLGREIMRSFHSIKGGARVLLSLLEEAELRALVKQIEEVSHLLEEVVQRTTAAGNELDSEFFGLVYRGVDILKSLQQGFGSGRKGEIGSLVAEFQKMVSSSQKGKAGASSGEKTVEDAQAADQVFQDFGLQLLELLKSSLRSESPNWKLIEQNAASLKEWAGKRGFREAVDLLEEVLAASQKKGREELEGAYEKLRRWFEEAASEKKLPQTAKKKADISISLDFQKIRVDQSKIDALVNLAGELLTLRNRYGYLLKKVENSPFAREFKVLFTELGRISTTLQNVTLSMRMVPLGMLFDRYRRTVRDLAQELRKKVELVVEGKDTELDRGVVQMLVDPLTHLVRNAVDHGIELPEEREKAGKPPLGKVILQAFQRGESVIIRVEDDGRGIDPNEVRMKAVDKGFISAEEALALSDEEALNLIFLPGFSTSSSVSEISGRGVGMDVVKANIEQIGGRVSITSQIGKGTLVEMKIPLSLSIIRGISVQIGCEEFVIPFENVETLVRVSREDVHGYRGSSLVRVRGEVLPLFFAASLLGMFSPAENSCGSEIPLVLLRVSQGRYALAVDNYDKGGEFLVKPLPFYVSGGGLFSGATIRGDGKAILVLNPERLVELGGGL
ncbi:MAG: chemotaxis protein CheA [Candidatus Atribacteria bacterium]|nr:chemotaxis protein CheA [Candidatus Atribacteria bacterium]MCD6349320.1 chemotaxis protein CheA [Candidatus Atribacteria bacterium]